MANLTVKKIRELGREIVFRNPGGVRFKDIVNEIIDNNPETAKNTIIGQIANSLVPSFPNQIAKPSRGLYVPIEDKAEESEASPSQISSTSRKEEDFYEAFATYLQDDLDEATAAVSVGGAAFRTKWGTPDVVGVYRPLTSDLIKFTPEIIVAEIKIDPYQAIVAFGQAVAYRLFATRSYVVMPSSMTQEDQSRLEALSILFGIGFVLFDSNSPSNPNFQIRVRAQGAVPDSFYVNEFARRLNDAHPESFSKLFQ